MNEDNKFSVIESLAEYREWCREMMAGAKPLSATKMQFAATIWGINRMLKAIEATRKIYNRTNCNKR